MEIVAIIGRPNVGKSSLFNRIVGHRKSIVNEKSGVTRDRVYESVDLDGKSVTFVDTGGFEPEKGNRIKNLILKQTQAAITEADKIILLFDGRKGILPDDRELVNKLRSSKKDIFYGINKVDLKETQKNIYDFYSLGLDDVMEISASNGTGVKELLKRISSSLKEDSNKVKSAVYPGIAVVGRPNVGKSSIVNRLLDSERVMVDDSPGTTRDSVDTVFDYAGKRFILVDTAGIRRRSRIDDDLEAVSVMSALRSIDRAEFVVLVIDASAEIAHQDLKIAEYAKSRGKALITIVNKIDKIEQRENIDWEEFKLRIAKVYPGLSHVPFVFVSAKLKENLPVIMTELEQVGISYSKKIPTKEINRFIKTSGINEKIKRLPTRKKVKGKISYVTQTDIKPPRFVVFCNQPEFIKKKYDSFLKNQFREKFGFKGVPLEFIYKKK